MVRTPIEAWPTVTHGGRPGYSAHHFAMLAGGQDDPLRTASRILCATLSTALATEAAERLASGHEDPSSVMNWLSNEQTKRNADAWYRLCQSFDLVISTLESAPKLPGVRKMLREAKRAALAVRK